MFAIRGQRAKLATGPLRPTLLFACNKPLLGLSCP